MFFLGWFFSQIWFNFQKANFGLKAKHSSVVYIWFWNDFLFNFNKILISLKINKIMIKKIRGGYKVLSESGRNMGTYKTLKEAKNRLRQIEYFKHENKNK